MIYEERKERKRLEETERVNSFEFEGKLERKRNFPF